MALSRPPRTKPAYCAEQGMLAAAGHVISAGLADGYTSPEDWLDAVFEGKTENLLAQIGWVPHCGATRCRRAKKCAINRAARHEGFAHLRTIKSSGRIPAPARECDRLCRQAEG